MPERSARIAAVKDMYRLVAPCRSSVVSMLPIWIKFIFMLTLLSSCASLNDQNIHEQLQAYIPDGDITTAVRHAPVFIVENPDSAFNRIGTARAGISPEGEEDIFIDSRSPTLYFQETSFQTEKSTYTNLIYRVHFEKIPFSFIPFYLGAGKNVGLLVIVTLDKTGVPILYTTVNSCGCYLAFVPTTFMPTDAFPDAWPQGRQTVYTENLPAILDIRSHNSGQEKTMVLLRDGTHRVKDIRIARLDSVESYSVKAHILPLQSLENLSLADGSTTSFYQEKSSGKGYVKGTTKIWERLFMGWWALDWRVGEDKKLGTDKKDPPVFYTSLKPWARDKSDLRDFTSFLVYWGWKL